MQFHDLPKSHCGIALTSVWLYWLISCASTNTCLAQAAKTDVDRQTVDRTVADWQIVKAPEVWSKPPSGKQGYSWYRCVVDVPAAWQGKDVELFIEPVDDAREIYINGSKVGAFGSFPPEFRSGLGEPDRHRVDSKTLVFGQPNAFAIRVFDSDGRGGFNVAAPVLFAGGEAIRLIGAWQFRAGDNPQWSQLDEALLASADVRRATVQSASEVARILRRLPGEEGPLSPEESLRKFKTSAGLQVELALSEPHIGQPLSLKFDERGRLWVMQYLQYPNPAGLKMVSRDKFLRTVYDKSPLPPPNHFPGADKITIHEDSDLDGKFDRHQTFLEGLSLATSIEFDRDGLWVLNPPYLLFYPDRNHDDVPDGNPEVHLEGFGLEDSHSVTNNLRYGPDGWLYASQGSTVTGNIRRYGSQDKPIHSMGQLIWRYHPVQRRYEIFAEGGGNSFGVEFDAKGRVYSGHNGGDTRGFHYVQGGYYRKGFGKHGALSNPYTYGYFEMMRHHSVPRFTHTFVIYEGGALGSAYEGKLFGISPLLSHVVYSQVVPEGSTFKTSDVGLALSTDDLWFRPVDIHAGPDGAIYVADMYEQRIDHAAHYQGRTDRGSGRVYRLKASDAQGIERVDLGKLGTDDLVRLLHSENKWYRQAALKSLRVRHDTSAIVALREKLFSSAGQESLEYLWALEACGGLTEEDALRALSHADPHVRLWSVRMVCDKTSVPQRLAGALVDLASSESYVEVRSQLACSAKRLPAEQCLPIVTKLLGYTEDASDPHLPLLLWWAIESKAESDRDAAIRLFESPELWNSTIAREHVVERLMRRFAQAGSQKDLAACAKLLELAPSDQHIHSLMAGFEKAYEGRPLTNLPDSLIAVMAKRGGGSLALRLRQSNPEAIAEALKLVTEEATKKAERIQLLQVLGQIHPPECEPSLLAIVEKSADSDVRIAAMTALQAYDNPQIGMQLVSGLSKLPADCQPIAFSLLASRPAWARAWLSAMESGALSSKSVPLDVVQRTTLHNDPQIEQAVRRIWGELKGTSSEDLRKKIADLSNKLTAGTGNPYKGKQLYKANCGKCHVLFEEGGLIGPSLTSYKRDDLTTMMVHIVNPSLQIREGYEAFMVLTDGGLAVTGFVADQDNRIVVLRTADGQTIVVPRDGIETMKASPKSIMPEGLLDNLDEQQVRDLFAFLRSTQPLN